MENKLDEILSKNIIDWAVQSATLEEVFMNLNNNLVK